MIRLTDIKNYKGFWDDFNKKHFTKKGNLVKALFDMIEKHGSGLILEIGSGFGRTYVDKRIGIDICKKFLLEDEGRVVLGDIRRMPFKDKSFGLAYAAWVLMHIHPDDIQVVADEINRVADRIIIMGLGEKVESTFCFFHDYKNIFNREPIETKVMSTEVDGIAPHRKQLLEVM